MSMQPAEIIEVEETSISCDGGGGAGGHPRVYLALDGNAVDCPYCGRRYVRKGAAAAVARNRNP